MIKAIVIKGKKNWDKDYRKELEEHFKELFMRMELKEEKKDQRDSQSLEDSRYNSLQESDIKIVVFSMIFVSSTITQDTTTYQCRPKEHQTDQKGVITMKKG